MPKVVVSLLDAGQEFQQLQAKDAREAASRLSLELEVAFAEGHAVVQIQQLFKHIHALPGERPVAIVVEPTTGEGLERVARNAVKAGIGWILVNADVAYLDELRAAHHELPIASVGTDQVEAGRIQGRQARALGAEVEAHEARRAKLRPRRQRHAVVEEKLVRVLHLQAAAIDPGQVGRLRWRHRQVQIFENEISVAQQVPDLCGKPVVALAIRRQRRRVAEDRW